MSLTFKLLSLAIRTAAKPIGNYIKRQAKDHEGFRRFAVAQAQRVHRIDMRMRLGILHDPAAQERMHEREQKAAEEKKRKAEVPTVRTEAEQQKFEEQKAKEEADEKEGKKKEDDKPTRVKIKPLSEARAIELGANFFSEAFIFAVAAGLLIWDSWRSRKKESERRDMVAERLQQLETEVLTLKSQLDPDMESLHEMSERMREAKKRRSSWSSYLGWSSGETPKEEAVKVEEPSAQLPTVKATGTQEDEKKEEEAEDLKSKESNSNAGSKVSSAPPTALMNTVTASQKNR